MYYKLNSLYSADNLHPDNYQIKLGDFDQSINTESGEKVVKVSEVHLHPKYNGNTVQWDISLLKVIPYTHTCPTHITVGHARRIHQPHIARVLAGKRQQHLRADTRGVGDRMGHAQGYCCECK
jgi:hypothetical protein